MCKNMHQSTIGFSHKKLLVEELAVRHRGHVFAVRLLSVFFFFGWDWEEDTCLLLVITYKKIAKCCTFFNEAYR